MNEALVTFDNELPRRESLAQQTYDLLKEKITTGQLAPEARFSEAELARQLNISRAPLREAVRQLQEEGLLTSSDGRGLNVPPISVEMVRELYEVRLALEGAAAELAGGRIPDKQVRHMRKALDALRDPIMAGDPHGFAELDHTFHDLWVRNCGNSLLTQHTERLRDHLRRVFAYAGGLPEHTKQAFREHESILLAIEDGDPATVRSEVENHIRSVSGRLCATLAGRG